MKAEPLAFTRDDFILSQLRDIKDGQRDLRQELKEARQELNGRMDRMENRMDKIENEMRSMIRHSQILTVSVLGLIAAVVFSLFK